ncbi:MAG: hypothetical protein WCY48_03680 [Candidatus Caldatribacteriota bacterium]
MLRFVVLLSLFFSLPALAKKYELAQISNDLDKEIVTFYLHVDQYEKIDSISYITRNEHGQIVKEMDWTYGEVANGGVVLETRNGYDILNLFLGSNFNRDQGGEISLNYLHNGVTGSRRYMNFNVTNYKGSYRLFYNGKIVSKLNIKTNHVRVIGLVGIDRIQVFYAQ